MEFGWDGIISIGILFFIIFIIYSKVRGQGMKETFDEIKELFTGGKE